MTAHVGHNGTHTVYLLSCEEFDQLVIRAAGWCDRCSGEMRDPRIEHDHTIGKRAVRGLVCHQCNIIIAMIERGERPGDELTSTYLADPFHRTIPEFMPGYRPPHKMPLDIRPYLDPEIPDLVSLEEVAVALKLRKKGVLDLVMVGRLKGRRVGATWVFRRSAVEALR